MIMDKASKQQLQASQGQQSQAESAIGGAVMTKSTTDVLETAVRLGVKIIAAKKMYEFLYQRNLMPGSHALEQSPSVMKSVKAIPMIGKYIKVEAADQRTRAKYQVFEHTWPDMVLEPGTGCPFKLTTVSPEVSERMELERKKRQQQQLSTKESNSHRQQAVHGSTNLTTQLTPVVTPQDGNHSRIIAGGGRRTAVASWSRITPQTVGQATNTARALVRAQQGLKRKVMFCELCGVDYDKLSDHLKTHTHERFLNDPDNFKELMSVISSLPKLSDLEAEKIPVVHNDAVPVEGVENMPPCHKLHTNQLAGEEEAKTEAGETSAYDVNYLKNRMSAATIASPTDSVPVMHHVDDMEL